MEKEHLIESRMTNIIYLIKEAKDKLEEIEIIINDFQQKYKELNKKDCNPEITKQCDEPLDFGNHICSVCPRNKNK